MDYGKFIVLNSFFLYIVSANTFKTDIVPMLPEEKLSEAAFAVFNKVADHEKRLCGSNGCSPREKFDSIGFETIFDETQLKLELKCVEDTKVTVFWSAKSNLTYILEVLEENSDTKTFTKAVQYNIYTIQNLQANTTYKIRLWAISIQKRQIIFGIYKKVTTAKRSAVPSPVADIWVQNLTLYDDIYEATIEWKPNKEGSCYYDLVWFGDGPVEEEVVNVASESHRIKLRPLRFEANYTLKIVARNSEHSPFESEQRILVFSTPSCLEAYGTLLKCPPEMPSNFTISENIVEITPEKKLLYEVILNWSKPVYVPDYYEAHFINIISDDRMNNEFFLNITGNATVAVFHRVELGVLYQVSLMACSSAGCSKKVVEDRHQTDIASINISTNHQWTSSLLTIVILVPLLAILIIVAAIFFSKQYWTKRKRSVQSYKYVTDPHEIMDDPKNKSQHNITGKHISDKWELDPTKLRLGNVLGEGAFGVVRKACLSSKEFDDLEVAVKMLKESPSAEEVRHFKQEIDIMKSVGQHPNIVSLIGCTTVRRIEGPLLVVEYCSRGDLQTYLRNAWDLFCNLSREATDAQESPTKYFANKLYDLQDSNRDSELILEPKHLLSIARQVSLGMEHLAKTRVVHRDLAARNVLVCENHTVKVSDFGLSRDVYQNNVYCKNGGGKLPIRWMALESLTHQRYTTQSDVWSFGVLLWEIVTLGATPYVGLQTCELLDFLKSGNRLKCPPTCSSALYDIMMGCWNASPSSRPNFTELCRSLEDLLENVSQYLHLENMAPTNEEKLENTTQSYSYEHYMKPNLIGT